MNPQKAWNKLGWRTQRRVRELAFKGKLHPDAAVRETSIEWAGDLFARWKLLLLKFLAQIAGCVVAVAVVATVVVRVFDWDDRWIRLSAMSAASATFLIGMEFYAARKILTAAGAPEVAADGATPEDGD